MLGRAMVRTATCVYHFILLNWYIFLNYYVPQQGTIFQGGAQSKYLTLLNLAVYFGVACLDDVLKRIKRKKDIKFITALRDLLFATLAFPVCTFVFLMFWTIFLYDRELVYPKLLDGILPAWLNHSVVSEGEIHWTQSTNSLSTENPNLPPPATSTSLLTPRPITACLKSLLRVGSRCKPVLY